MGLPEALALTLRNMLWKILFPYKNPGLTYVWLHLLSIMFSRFNHTFLCANSLFLFTAGYYSTVWMHKLSFHSLLDGHLSHFLGLGCYEHSQASLCADVGSPGSAYISWGGTAHYILKSKHSLLWLSLHPVRQVENGIFLLEKLPERSKMLHRFLTCTLLVYERVWRLRTQAPHHILPLWFSSAFRAHGKEEDGTSASEFRAIHMSLQQEDGSHSSVFSVSFTVL